MRSDATERVREIIVSLGAEMGHRHGWKRAVATRLGVHPSYIGKIVASETREVGASLLQRAEAVARGEDPSPDDDGDLRAMASLIKIMGSLDDGARDRVLAWANARWGAP